MLLDLVEEYLVEQRKCEKNICFHSIASAIPGRDATQCRNRYRDYLDPTLETSPLDDEEVKFVLEVRPFVCFTIPATSPSFILLTFCFHSWSQCKLRGLSWSEIKALLLEERWIKRSANALKNLWNRSTLQKVIQEVENDRELLYGKRHRTYGESLHFVLCCLLCLNSARRHLHNLGEIPCGISFLLHCFNTFSDE